MLEDLIKMFYEKPIWEIFCMTHHMIKHYFTTHKLNCAIKPRHLIAFFLYVSSPTALLLSQASYADENDTINFIAGISQQHDDNLFRTPTSERSDNITSASAGIRIDKPYAMQRFKFDYTFTANKYQTNDFLNFNAKEYKAAWLWALTPYLTGTLAAERSQSLYGFLDYTNFQSRNISTINNRHFEADYSPHGNWHLLAGYSQLNVVNTQTFLADRGFTMNGLDVGVKYVFPSGTTVALRGHDRKGSYDNTILDSVNLLDTGFDEREGEATLDWILTGKSNISLRTAYITHEHDHFAQRDYSGLVGRMSYNWTPTGKLRLSLTASRDLASYQTAFSNYTRNDTLSFSPVYSISSKITAKAAVSVTERTFLGSDTLASNGRVDTSKSASLGVDWAPYRSVSFGANVRHSSRSSNISGFDFTDTTAGLTANVHF